MTSFTVTARFPAGQFNAHGRDGEPEWPPAPARLAAALLSAAYESGTGVKAVEGLFALDPPDISAPRVGERGVGYGRWVPTNNEIKEERGKPIGIVDDKKRFADKGFKSPERGVVIGAGPHDLVRWCFRGARDADTEVLRRVARNVAYLGRPTSPVILDVVTGAQNPPEDHDRWIPDENGTRVLRVATPDLLRALDEREEQRRRSRVTGTHPTLDVRPTARYRFDGDNERPVAPRPSEVLADAVLYRFPGGRSGGVIVAASDVATIVDQLKGQVPTLTWVLPLFGNIGRRGLPVLRGIAVRADSVPDEAAFAVRGGVVTARRAEPRALASLPRVVRAATAPSEAWTSVVPIGTGPEAVDARLRALAEDLGVRLVRAERHALARASVGPDAREPGGATHLTVVFDRAAAGPVILDGVWLVPEGADGLAVNGRRSAR